MHIKKTVSISSSLVRVAGLALLIIVSIDRSSAAPVLVANFESPVYTSGTNFAGVDNWSLVSGGVNTKVTPDPLGSGLRMVLSGSQSGFVYDAVVRKPFANFGFNTPEVKAANLWEITWLQATPSVDIPNGFSMGLYVISNTSTSTPFAVIARTVSGVTNIWLGSTGYAGFFYDTGVPYITGATGVGLANPNQMYAFTMDLNFATSTMTAYYDTGSGKVSLGSIPIDAAVTATSLANGFGIGLGSSTTRFGVFDNIYITAIPEPSSIALFGVAGGLLALRARRS